MSDPPRTLVEHQQRRRDFFERFGHLWPETLTDEFDILEPRPLHRRAVDEILTTAARLIDIYEAVIPVLRNLPLHLLAQLGISHDLVQLILSDTTDLNRIPLLRFDLAQVDGKYVMLELNADVPGLVVETFSLNKYACGHSGLEDPCPDSESALRRALTAALESAAPGAKTGLVANVVCTARRSCFRDAAIARYIASLPSGEGRSVRYAPIEDLLFDGVGLVDPSGTSIDVLYRLLPLRYFRGPMFVRLGHASFDSTSRVRGEIVYALVRDRTVRLINSPLACLLESKAVQSVIWGLHERGLFFTPMQHLLIETHMLPCYFDPPGGTFVAKPMFGGEGDSVSVVDSSRGTVAASKSSTSAENPMVYQKYVNIPREILMTEFGPRELTLVTSCFLVAGRPMGVCLRAGSAVTDGNAWIVPVGVET